LAKIHLFFDDPQKDRDHPQKMSSDCQHQLLTVKVKIYNHPSLIWRDDQSD